MPSIAGIVELPGPTLRLDRLGAERERALEGVPGVDDAEGHGRAPRGRASAAKFAAKEPGSALRIRLMSPCR